MIKQKNSPEKAKQIFAKIDKIFSEAEISPTPVNYVVWYQYFLAENQALVNEINALPDGAKSFTDRLGARLYEQFIEEQESQEEIEYNFAVKKFVDNILHKMNDFSDGVKNRSQQIGDYAKDLHNAEANQNKIQEIAQFIIQEADNMQKSTDEIRNEVKNSTEEVKSLRAQLEKVQKEALTDELTQIGNRKAFNSLMQDLTIEFEQLPQSLCLIMTDIDHFKSFNDTYGHPVGDSVLRYYANILKKDTNENESICRYGGEEFAIIIKNTTLEEAAKRAEQIREQIEAVKLTLKDSSEPIRTITASFGVSHFNGNTDNIEEFIERADKSLYAAKEAGRNTVMHENMLN